MDLLQELQSMLATEGQGDQAGVLYRAEQHAMYPGMSYDEAVARPKDFANAAEAMAWVAAIQRKPAVRKLWPKFAASKVEIRFNLTEPMAGGRTDNVTGLIEIAPNGFGASKDTILHELVHVILTREGNLETEPHGKLFAATRIKLLRIVQGPKAAAYLAKFYNTEHVKWH